MSERKSNSKTLTKLALTRRRNGALRLPAVQGPRRRLRWKRPDPFSPQLPDSPAGFLGGRPKGGDEAAGIFQIVHPAGIGFRGLEQFALLNVDRHAKAVRDLPVTRQVLVCVESGEGRHIKPYVPAPGAGWFRVCIVLCH